MMAALLLGFLGSAHCIGMCSPLALAATNLSKPFFGRRLFYNGGRIISYGVLGVIASSAGSLFQFTGLQQTLGIGLGILLIVVGLSGTTHLRVPLITNLIQTATGVIKKKFSHFLAKRTRASLFFMGSLNGLLPCGLTYLALTYCVTLPQPVDGFFFMLTFGLGTLPVMLGLTSVIQIALTRFRIDLRRVITITTVVLGILLISRSVFVGMGHQHETPDNTTVTICR